MELVYLWVEDYKNIHKQGFNFSPRFNCNYDPDTNKLTIDENDDYIENFFGDDINVTAIVGKNGSGKSSLLNFIINCNEDNNIHNYILIVNNNHQIYYKSNISNINTNITISKLNNNLDFIINVDRKDNDNIPIDAGATIHSIQEKYPWVNYREFATKNNEITNLIAINIGNYDPNFRLSTFMYLPKKINIKLKSHEELIGRFIRFVARDRSEIENYFLGISDSKHRILILKYLKSGKALDDKNVINNIKNKNFLNDEFSQDTKLNIFTSNIHQLQIGIEKEIIELPEEEKDLYLRKDGYYDLLDFDFIDSNGRHYNDLSSGEQKIYKQLLNIYFYSKTDRKKHIFLMDEPDLSLHPNWQKKYFFEVHRLLKQRSSKYHCILTTHSPFLLSDIPKQNIIFLDTDENGNCKVVDGLKDKKETFGANIHTLLSDSFFMEDGLMGEFAKGKINEIIEFHNIVSEDRHKECLKKIYEKRKNRFWQTQSIIGEEYLKQIIKNHLVEIEKILLGKDKAKEEEIKRVEKYLESLKND